MSWVALGLGLLIVAELGLVLLALGALRDELAAAGETATAALREERVVVTLTDGSSIRGVLVDDRPNVVVLGHAEYLNGRQPEAFAGRAVLPREHVRWIQVPGADN